MESGDNSKQQQQQQQQRPKNKERAKDKAKDKDDSFIIVNNFHDYFKTNGIPINVDAIQVLQKSSEEFLVDAISKIKKGEVTLPSFE